MLVSTFVPSLIFKRAFSELSHLGMLCIGIFIAEGKESDHASSGSWLDSARGYSDSRNKDLVDVGTKQPCRDLDGCVGYDYGSNRCGFRDNLPEVSLV